MTPAFEVKFLVDPGTASGIRDWARSRLEPDPHGKGSFHDEYRTTSLYFDTTAFDVFHRRGSFGRSKYRIRRYDAEAVAFLERKLRRATRLVKRRSSVSIDDLKRLDTEADGAWPGSWFEQRLHARRLHPVCQISYLRTARQTVRDDGAIRLTLDENVRVTRQTRAAFIGDDSLPVLPDKMVLELKYRQAMPALFKQLVEAFTLAPVRVSKYRFAAATLGLAAEGRQRDVCLTS